MFRFPSYFFPQADQAFASLLIGLDDFNEHINQLWVKLRAAATDQFLACIRFQHWLMICTGGGHCIIGIGNTEDACAKWDIFGFQATGISVAVPALMVVFDVTDDDTQFFDRLQDGVAIKG